MSKRPISINDLLKQDVITPKYVHKSKRVKLEKNKYIPSPKPESKSELEPVNAVSESVSSSSKALKVSTIPTPQASKQPGQLRSRKFQFDWDETEDTTRNELSRLGDQDDDDDGVFYDPLLKDDANTHWKSKKLAQMTDRDWRIFNEDYGIITKGKNIPHGARYWNESGLSLELVSIIEKFGFVEPTPVQRASIPISLQQRDMVGVAETGSGKTLAFLLPIFHYLQNIDLNYIKYEKIKNEPLALILAPTRELALQIAKEAEKFCCKLGYNVMSIIGGRQYQDTINEIDSSSGRGIHIVVGTPGRLLDSIDRKMLNFGKCYYLVMDEADRMIDMGFEKDLNKLINQLPKSENLVNSIDGRLFHLEKRLTMMYTATISPPIEKITKSYLVDPAYVYIGGAGEALDNIDQKFDYLGSPKTESIKVSKLLKVIQQHNRSVRQPLIIIFANFKHVCEALSQELENNNLHNVVIHGSKSQQMREEALEEFKRYESPILIATDVAARGIDVPNVSLVINYQMCSKFDEYIHRIGRTGRAGNYGESFTFLDDNDSNIFIPLKKFLKKGGKKLPEWLYRYSISSV
ncbi:PRP28 [Candida oxycetoniae]|uniref:RNA helicase n=1 Tax=Candida oxycetoniae TaxID=497107 RepID=A0AAI9SYX9_9ASCO|nr:PRP28 [Candida oxycetoniae]KAI3405788.2 PRP28 [Candida oxycetoniae]